MADADVKLDGADAIVEGNWLTAKCLDIKLDAAARRSSNSGERRALVHGFNDELVVNYNSDYPGGATINGEVRIPDKIKQNHVRLESTDLHINHPDRRSTPSGDRRAVVHGFNDELVLNFNKDYPGGVAVHGHLNVQKSGSVRLYNNSGDKVAELDRYGNLTIGGNGADGDIMCKDGQGRELIRLDTEHKRIDFKDTSGDVKVRIDTDHFSTASWPTLPGESAPSRLDLLTEIKKLKEEVVALRNEVNALSTP